MDKCCVLIVDDDTSFLNLLEAVLEEMGHSVISAKNGAEALELATRRQPHLIISDINMPDMDGVELNTHLQLNPLTKGIPTLMLTGNDFKQMEISINYAFTLKFEYILSKKATLEQISEKVREILERYYQA